MTENYFSNRLKILRKEKNLTQKEIAKKIGIGPSSMSNYEQGTRFPDKATLKLIADFHEVSIDYLLGRTQTRDTSDQIKKALSEDPELERFYEKVSSRDDLKLLFRQAKDLSPASVRQIVRIIKAIEEEDKNGGEENQKH